MWYGYLYTPYAWTYPTGGLGEPTGVWPYYWYSQRTGRGGCREHAP